jgi:hypothetical protein
MIHWRAGQYHRGCYRIVSNLRSHLDTEACKLALWDPDGRYGIRGTPNLHI